MDIVFFAHGENLKFQVAYVPRKSKREKRMHYQLGSYFVDCTFLTSVFLFWTHVAWVVANCFQKFRGSTPLSLRGYARRDWSCPSICDSHALHFLLGLLLPETYPSKTQKIQGVVALPRSYLQKLSQDTITQFHAVCCGTSSSQQGQFKRLLPNVKLEALAMPPPSAHVSKIWSRSPLMCGGRQEGRKTWREMDSFGIFQDYFFQDFWSKVGRLWWRSTRSIWSSRRAKLQVIQKKNDFKI